MKTFLSLFNILIFSAFMQAQISMPGTPLSFGKKTIGADIPVIHLPTVDADALLAEDEAGAVYGNIPYRFGTDIEVSYNTDNSGVWHNLPNGGRVWRLGIASAGAYSLNFIMDRFYLPRGAALYILNPDTKDFIGAFTTHNNNADSVFATAPLSGSMVILELYEPADKKGMSTVSIQYVIHAYRNIFSTVKSISSSGACNINVNCPEGLLWQNEKRAVAMILSANNTSVCSGALVNNVRQDGTPYFLTANHCLMGANSSTWIFMFNYESATCIGTNGPNHQTVQGSVIRARDNSSDFALLELNTAPPLDFNVYFAGWSAVDVASDSCVGIHHPSGDIKKISFDFDSVSSSGYSGPGNTHWRIGEWELGTTEGGSSGSPLFSKHRKIIGQLHGGTASCNNPSGYDVYGKFSHSWDTGSTPDKRLKDWLDPDDTGTLVLDGADFNMPLYNTDAALLLIESPLTGVICALDINPKVIIKNNGSDTLTSLNINYTLNGGTPETFVWSGSLNFLQAETVSLPTLYLNEGVYDMKIYIDNPNNNNDENLSNDTLSVIFEALLGNEVVLTLTTDNYPNETSWKIVDTLAVELYSSGALAPQTTYTHDLCLPDGCYNFIILDSYGDGLIGGGWINPAPPGSYEVMHQGVSLGNGGGNFGFADTIHFCVNTAGINNSHKSSLWHIYPNPAQDVLHITSTDTESSMLQIYNIEGRLLKDINLQNNHTSISTSDLPSGMYILKFSSKTGLFFERLIICK